MGTQREREITYWPQAYGLRLAKRWATELKGNVKGDRHPYGNGYRHALSDLCQEIDKALKKFGEAT